MASFFSLLNLYEDQIVASLTIVLGGLQTSVSSWAIHMLVLDEHFLLFVIGDMMGKINPLPAKEDFKRKYSSAHEYVESRTGAFETLTWTKIAFSLALVSGVTQILISFFLLCMKKIKKYRIVRYIWTFLSIISASLLATSFVILWIYWVKNVPYFQISLSFIGVNFFVMAHLIASIAPSVILEIFTRYRNKSALEEAKVKNQYGSSKAGLSTASTSTTSLIKVDGMSSKVEMTPETVHSISETMRSQKSRSSSKVDETMGVHSQPTSKVTPHEETKVFHTRSFSKVITPDDISLPLPPPPPSPTELNPRA